MKKIIVPIVMLLSAFSITQYFLIEQSKAEVQRTLDRTYQDYEMFVVEDLDRCYDRFENMATDGEVLFILQDVEFLLRDVYFTDLPPDLQMFVHELRQAKEEYVLCQRRRG